MARERVAIFLPDVRGGGAERSIINLARTMAVAYDVDLVLAQQGGALIADVPHEVRLVELDASRVATSLPSLVRYLRSEKPDALLSALNHANVVAIIAARLTRTRVVASEHSHLTTATSRARRWRDRVMPVVLRLVYRHADAITGVSEGVVADLVSRARLDPTRVHVVVNPIDVDDLRARAAGPTGHPFVDGAGVPVILAVGRLTEQKDFPNLLRAVARCGETQEVRLVILGEGEERAALEREVEELGLSGVVSLPGFVPNPYPFMRAADVFVLSSRWEGLPTVLLEALAVGTKVVSTDCPSGPDEILDRGRFGTLVPVGDPDALADAILDAIGAPRPAVEEALTAYAPANVRRRYAAVLGLPGEG